MTSESLDVGSPYLDIRCICSEYGSSSEMYESHRVNFKVTGAKTVENA